MDKDFPTVGLAVTQALTQVNFRPGGPGRRVDYLVVHYVGATGSAQQNANYYHSVYRGASAHYFVDFDGSVVQMVADGDIAWHCGTQGRYRHPRCRNHNSIGIELCVRNQRGGVRETGPDAGWYFEPATVEGAQRLLQVLMDRYGVPPDHILRHYDVTGKICPAPFCNGQLDWTAFKAGIPGSPREQEDTDMTDEEFAEKMANYLNMRTALGGSPWSHGDRGWATSTALIRGDDTGRMGWQRFITVEQAAALFHRYDTVRRVADVFPGKKQSKLER